MKAPNCAVKEVHYIETSSTAYGILLIGIAREDVAREYIWNRLQIHLVPVVIETVANSSWQLQFIITYHHVWISSQFVWGKNVM
jgi:hypothetical protein